jgi:hypothetical protein
MADENGMVTLNIYNNPPPQTVDNSSTDFNQTAQNFNLNTDKPQPNPNYYDNVRNVPPPNYNSAPRNQYNNRNMQSSIEDESSNSTQNNQRNVVPVIPMRPQYVQYQQQPYYQPMPLQQNVMVPQPGMVPYNTPYGQPVVVQQARQTNTNNNRGVNNAPQTIIIREKERPTSHRNGTEDCCAGCLAGVGSCLACLCLMGLCCPPPHHGPHHIW